MGASKGLLVVISGPAGTGKGTLVHALLDKHEDMKLSVSATTRQPRPGEVNGVHYFFISENEFERMIENHEFLEYMHVFGMNYYGTPRKFVEDQLEQGIDVILEIDVNGASNIKKAFPDAVLIFIAPPSMGELKARLVGRATETEAQIEKRFATAFDEIKTIPNYDYVVVNDVIDIAVSKLENIISAEKCRTKNNTSLIGILQGGN